MYVKVNGPKLTFQIIEWVGKSSTKGPSISANKARETYKCISVFQKTQSDEDKDKDKESELHAAEEITEELVH